MSRSPVQLAESTKAALEALKERTDFRYCKTHSDVVQKLIDSFHAAERQRNADRDAREQEKARKAAEDVYLGADLKRSYMELGTEFGISSEPDIAMLLLDHWHTQEQVSKATLSLMMRLRRG